MKHLLIVATLIAFNTAAFADNIPGFRKDHPRRGASRYIDRRHGLVSRRRWR